MSSKPFKKSEVDSAIHQYLTNRARGLSEAAGLKKEGRAGVIAAQNALFLEGLGDILTKHPFPAVKPYKGKSKANTDRILNVMLSDLHYGADLDPAETRWKYGPVEEARRTAAIAVQVADYKRHYRDSTILYVHLMGDIIQGKLHDPEDAAPLTEQFHRALWNLGQAITFLSTEFKKVVVFCTPGNHGRRKDRHHVRAVNQKWDSIEGMLYISLDMALKNLKNVEIRTFATPYYIFDAFGNKGFMTHGDTVLKPGFPGSNIAVGSVHKQTSDINAGLGSQEACQLFGVGHVHTSSATRLANGVMFLTNGCLIPSDAYAQSIGLFSVTCTQKIFESVPGFIYGDSRDAIVGSDTDRAKELDKVIIPCKPLYK